MSKGWIILGLIAVFGSVAKEARKALEFFVAKRIARCAAWISGDTDDLDERGLHIDTLRDNPSRALLDSLMFLAKSPHERWTGNWFGACRDAADASAFLYWLTAPLVLLFYVVGSASIIMEKGVSYASVSADAFALAIWTGLFASALHRITRKHVGPRRRFSFFLVAGMMMALFGSAWLSEFVPSMPFHAHLLARAAILLPVYMVAFSVHGSVISDAGGLKNLVRGMWAAILGLFSTALVSLGLVALAFGILASSIARQPGAQVGKLVAISVAFVIACGILMACAAWLARVAKRQLARLSPVALTVASEDDPKSPFRVVWNKDEAAFVPVDRQIAS